jgi:hypothetical protein
MGLLPSPAIKDHIFTNSLCTMPLIRHRLLIAAAATFFRVENLGGTLKEQPQQQEKRNAVLAINDFTGG